MRTYHLVIEKQTRGKPVRIERDITARDIRSARRKVGVREARGAQALTLRGTGPSNGAPGAL
jgi:hypothetical protein